MKFPPLLQLVASLGLAWLLANYLAVFGFTVPAPVVFVVAGSGLVFLLYALAAFRRRKTSVDPLTPSKASTLVTDGVYGVTRNPMYVGMALLLIAWCLYLGELSAWASAPVFLWTMTRFQIRAEEAALIDIFGDDYRQYKSRVGRWLWF